MFGDQLSAFQPSAWNTLGVKMNDFSQSMAGNLGLVTSGINTIGNLANMFNGMKQTNLYEKQLAQQQQQWQANYNNQVQMTNEQLADRQRQRVAANPNAESVDSYMSKWSVK